MHSVLTLQDFLSRSFYFILLTCLLCPAPKGFAQVVDSLEMQLTDPTLSTADRIETLYLLSRELTFVDLPRSLEFAEQSLELAKKTGNTRGMAYAYRILGSVYAINEDYFMGLQVLHRSMELFEKQSDSVGLANCYISLGHIHRKLKNRKKEIGFHQKAYSFFNSLNMRERLGVAAHNLGESHYLNGDLSEAERLTQLAIAINSEIGNLPVLSNCLKVQGLIELSRGYPEKAKAQFLEILELSQRLGDNAQKQAVAEGLIQLAGITSLEGNKNEAHEYLLKAEVLCQKYGLLDYLQRVYFQLSQFHLAQGHLSQAGRYLTLQDQAAQRSVDKLVSDRSRLTEGMVNITDLNQKADLLQSQSLLQSQKIEYRTRLLVVTGICLLILLWLVRKTWLMNRILRANNELIRKQKAELESLNATKDKFFSVVAHDIRSPLISLKSFVDLLIENYQGMTEAEVKVMATELDRSVKSTLRMADNLILWARDQMKKTQEAHTVFSLTEVLQDVFEVMRDAAEQKKITLVSPPYETTEVYGNRNQIEFIVRNLVNNAIKYTPPLGIVTMSLTREGDHRVKVSVTDTGMGMDETIIRDLFQLNTASSRPGTHGEKGTGLGLTLSYEFAKRNYSTIEVESAPQKGTSFHVLIRTHANAA